jgi:hypothetical protein
MSEFFFNLYRLMNDIYERFIESTPCTQIEGYGFYLDSCTWTWKWTMDTTEAILFQVGVCVLYLFLITFVQARKLCFQDNRWFNNIRFAHNIGLSVVSLLMMIVMVLHLHYSENRFKDWNTIACNNTPNTGIFHLAII